MDTKVGEISGIVDEFSKFARETADYLQERAAGLEKDMSKVMEGSGKEFAMKFGEGTKLGSFIEANPRRAALFALMSGLMFTRVLKSKGVGPVADTTPETEAGETSKPKTTAKAKAA